MKIGRIHHDVVLDYKGRLYLPTPAARKFKGADEASILIEKDGCLVICPCKSKFAMSEITRVPLARDKCKGKYPRVRVTIPKKLRELRDVVSFWNGPTVSIVCKRGCVKIQPRRVE